MLTPPRNDPTAKAAIDLCNTQPKQPKQYRQAWVNKKPVPIKDYILRIYNSNSDLIRVSRHVSFIDAEKKYQSISHKTIEHLTHTVTFEPERDIVY